MAHNFHPIHRYSSRNLSIFLRDLTVHQSKPYAHLTAESHHHGLIIIPHVVYGMKNYSTDPSSAPIIVSRVEIFAGTANSRSVPRDGCRLLVQLAEENRILLTAMYKLQE